MKIEVKLTNNDGETSIRELSIKQAERLLYALMNLRQQQPDKIVISKSLVATYHLKFEAITNRPQVYLVLQETINDKMQVFELNYNDCFHLKYELIKKAKLIDRS